MLNRCVLVGRLTADPNLRFTPNGVAVATFTLAVNRPFSKDGQKEADFINCVVWRKPAENAANYLKKGSLAGVDGRIQTRNYEGSDGKKIYVTEVVAESVQFLDTKSSSEQRGSRSENKEQQGSPFGSSNRSQSSKNDDPFANSGQPIDISDDDLPF